MAMQPTPSPRPPNGSPGLGMPGKSYDTVDNGEFQDYSGYEWFKDAPPKQEVCFLSSSMKSSELTRYDSGLHPILHIFHRKR